VISREVSTPTASRRREDPTRVCSKPAKFDDIDIGERVTVRRMNKERGSGGNSPRSESTAVRRAVTFV
jgi:hypothetical protein